jgi:hypothetical protein
MPMMQRFLRRQHTFNSRIYIDSLDDNGLKRLVQQLLAE